MLPNNLICVYGMTYHYGLNEQQKVNKFVMFSMNAWCLQIIRSIDKLLNKNDKKIWYGWNLK